ncbi:MAG: tRNA (N6-threonylcarbamoyladenosine(37)-N6)-methyltransferase TrmO [Gammaproteobacteria bacterium]|nr:tRNA (N6-threonylcarbamoyladenosine(37)-N6)-methyltransferase TrmO [Gammaproteobacteria bacterium]
MSLSPIGFLRTAAASKVEAPRQPGAAAGVRGRIELLPGRNFEHALQDLEGWERIWVLFWFHQNSTWRPKVLPPRSTTGRKGVFATRAPYRPNPLGLSALRLDGIDGLTVHVEGVDMLDGTPVLDIKPYVPYTDAWPAARSGWLEVAVPDHGRGGAAADPVVAYQLSFAAAATEQARWIEARTGLPIRERIMAILSIGPAPHPYRRIRRDGDAFRLAVREWRVRFRVAGRQVTVEEIGSGFRAAQLASPGDDIVEAHRAFVRAFCS